MGVPADSGFFNEDFWRSFFGSIIGSLFLVAAMSATAVATYTFLLQKSLRFGKFAGVWIMLTVFLFLGLIVLKLNISRPVVVSADASLDGTVQGLSGTVADLKGSIEKLVVAVGPFYGRNMLVVMTDVAHELARQVLDQGEDPTGNDVALDLGEPEFDLIEPRGITRREVQMQFGMSGQKLLDHVLDCANRSMS